MAVVVDVESAPELIHGLSSPRFREDSVPAGPDIQRVWLELDNVGFSVKDKVILKGINAILPPGELVALMGPSGAGKTTLINVIAGRAHGEVTGSLLANKTVISKKVIKHYAKLVPQADNLNPVLTAKQTLEYTASLCIAEKSQRPDKVKQVLSSLSLESCEDVVIGDNDTKGLSGGQIKRVSIGCELLSDPSILFLDEPTSGLDSKIAADVVDLLRAIARGGRSVLCTIHQPSFQVFSKFDRLIMLDRGSIAYDGPVNKVSDYLSAMGRPCPPFVNPADHLMNVLASDIPDQKYTSFSELFISMTEFSEQTRVKAATDREKCSQYIQSAASVAIEAEKKEEYAVSQLEQFKTLYAREFYTVIRDKRQLRTRAIQLVAIAIIIGTIFIRLGNEQSDVQVKISVMFLFLLFLGMSSIMATAIAMPVGKAVLQREFANGLYAMMPYYFGKLLVLITFQVIYAILFGSCLYFLVGFYPTASAFFVFLATLTIVSILAGTLGFSAGTAFPTVQAITATTPMMVLPLSIFAGLFISYSQIPKYWIWLYYISFFQYALQNMVINEFQYAQFDPCYQNETVCPYGTCNPSNPTVPLSCPGTAVLVQLNYNANNLGRNFGILIGEWCGFCIIGLLLLNRFLSKY